MDKFDIGVDKEEIRFLFKILYDKGKLSESEYKRALDKIAICITKTVLTL